ncbi:MAG: PelD GGDEF domain-containing protein [Azonexus sp.]|nr:PelD GGDEF domain-containing protein [Azonexus sp.]
MTPGNFTAGNSPNPSADHGLPGTSARKRSALDRVLGRLTASNGSSWAILSEILLLPLIAVGLGIALNPEDPLWIEANFPWAWFAPVVLALRYGPLAGMGAAGVLLLAWLGLNIGNVENFPKLPFLGGLILIMLVGEFSSLWVARTRRAETVQAYLDQRLEYLTHQYYLLRLSHDRLEQDLISRPMAMRDALKTLRNISASEHDQTQSSQTLLRLLAQYCQLETASLYPIENGQLSSTALASIGNAKPLVINDPLIQQMQLNNCLCHVGQTLEVQHQTSRYLIAAPLTGVDGENYGALVVEEIPFFSLQEETLQTINLLLGYYTDGLTMHALAQPIIAQLPDCPPEFAFEIQRLWHIGMTSSVSSIIVALEILPRASQHDMARQIQRLKRSLDENWLIEGVDRQLLATLMPLSDDSAAEGYLARLENWAQQKAGKTLAEIGIFSHILHLDQEQPIAILNQLKKLADVQSETGTLRSPS